MLYQRDAGVILARDGLAALLAIRRAVRSRAAGTRSVCDLTSMATRAGLKVAGCHDPCRLRRSSPQVRGRNSCSDTAKVDLDVRVTEQTVAWYRLARDHRRRR